MYPFIVTTISVRGSSQLDPPLHSWNFLIPIFLSCCVLYFLHFVLFAATRCNYYFTHRKLLSHSAGHCDQNNKSSPVFVVFDSELKALSTRVTYLSIAHSKLNICIYSPTILIRNNIVVAITNNRARRVHPFRVGKNIVIGVKLPLSPPTTTTHRRRVYRSQ